MRRVGILGGAFNPPHLGHLKLAELALRHLALQEVRFIPTAQSPHKPEPELTLDALARMRLLRSALTDTGLPFVADDLEIQRGGVSYTADTLETLHRRESDIGWILLVGSDQLPGLPSWRNVDRVFELASLAIAPRPGFALDLPSGYASRLVSLWSGGPGEMVWLPGTELPLSSSVLRDGIARGGHPEGLPIQVEAAIVRENYYRKEFGEIE